MSTSTPEPKIVEFGPFRIIGMNYVGKNEAGEIPDLWGRPNGFLARMSEVRMPEGAGDHATGDHLAFGLCRCYPGATDGTFEYVAAVPAAADAPIPDGMVEAAIGQSAYAVFESPTLKEIGATWGAAMAWMGQQTKWRGFCGPDECDCANHPSFELYPPGYDDDGPLLIYMPVRPA